MACGLNDDGQRGLITLVLGLGYTLVAAGGGHAALHQSEGFAMVSWLSNNGHCDLLALVGDMTYTQLLLVVATQVCSGAMALPLPAG